MLTGSMAYIDATLSNAQDSYQFHIDADDMKELMENAYNVLSNTLCQIGKFDIISFNSNVLNLENFNTLVEMHLNKK